MKKKIEKDKPKKRCRYKKCGKIIPLKDNPHGNREYCDNDNLGADSCYRKEKERVRIERQERKNKEQEKPRKQLEILERYYSGKRGVAKVVLKTVLDEGFDLEHYSNSFKEDIYNIICKILGDFYFYHDDNFLYFGKGERLVHKDYKDDSTWRTINKAFIGYGKIIDKIVEYNDKKNM
jgi:hypothetical protein